MTWLNFVLQRQKPKERKNIAPPGFELTASWFEALCALYCAADEYDVFGSILSTHLQESAQIVVVDLSVGISLVHS